jgi:deoxyribonuclease V
LNLHQGGALDQAELAFFADLQNLMSLRRKPLPKEIWRICAVDASYDRGSVAAVASQFKEGRMAEQSLFVGHCTFPYASGLLYLREGPFAVQAVRMLKERPQLVCFDAHGIAHPRSAGLATVGGMVVGLPSIGIAKSLVAGTVLADDGNVRRMYQNGRTVGFAARIGSGVRYWSPGYSVSIRELGTVMSRYGPICLQAMAESHKLSMMTIESVKRLNRNER